MEPPHVRLHVQVWPCVGMRSVPKSKGLTERPCRPRLLPLCLPFVPFLAPRHDATCAKRSKQHGPPAAAKLPPWQRARCPNPASSAEPSQRAITAKRALAPNLSWSTQGLGEGQPLPLPLPHVGSWLSSFAVVLLSVFGRGQGVSGDRRRCLGPLFTRWCLVFSSQEDDGGWRRFV
jgi:hypothetical protein